MAIRKTKNRVRNGRLRLWPSGWLSHRRAAPDALAPDSPQDRPVVATTEVPARLRAVAPGQRDITRDDLRKQITTAAIAFRGYDASNLGRGPELLGHPVYGPVVREMLDRASKVCGDVMKKEVDLAARMAALAPATL